MLRAFCKKFFRGLLWFCLVVCFLGIPSFLIFEGIKQILEIRQEQWKKDKVERCRQLLLVIENAKDQEKYFHRLFDRLFKRAEQSSNIERFFKKAFSKIRTDYGEHFTFVVWDGGGKLNERLSEIKGYNYLLKQAGAGLKAIAENAQAATSRPLKELPELSGRMIKILKSLLGRVLVVNHLDLPYRKFSEASIIFASSENRRAYFWHHFSRKLGLLIFIGKDAIDNYAGLKTSLSRQGLKPTTKAGKKNPDTELFYNVFSTGTNRFLASLDSPFELSHFQTALKEFRTFQKSPVEGPAGLFVFKNFGDELIGVGYIPFESSRLFYSILPWIAIVIVFLVCFPLLVSTFSVVVLEKKEFFPILWKTAFLLLYANGIPLLVIFFLGYQHILQKRAQLENELKLKAESMLEKFDVDFSTFKNFLEKNIESFFPNFEQSFFSPGFDLAGSLKPLRKFNSDSVFLLATDSAVVAPKGSKKKNLDFYAKDYGLRILGIFNHLDEEAFLGTKKSFFAPIGWNASFEKRRGKIQPWAFAGRNTQVFWELIKDPRTGDFPFLIYLSWLPGQLEAQYLRKRVWSANRNGSGIRFRVRNEFDKSVYPTSKHHSKILEKIFNRISRTKETFIEKTTEFGKESLVVGMKAKEINKFSFVGIFPLDEINREISSLKKVLIFLGFVSLFFTLGVIELLGKSFLRPIGLLREAAEQIERRKLNFRLSHPVKDEFGELVEIFNQTIEGMKEIHSARQLQESFFPKEEFSGSRLSVFLHRITDGEIVNDFTDLIYQDGEKLGVAVGRINEEGIIATLGVAMLKAGLITCRSENCRPVDTLRKINEVFIALKAGKTLPSASLAYIMCDGNLGRISLASAGFCAAFKILPNKGISSKILLSSVSLGEHSAPVFQETDLHLNAGEILLVVSRDIPTIERTVSGFFKAQSIANHFSDIAEELVKIFGAEIKRLQPGASNFSVACFFGNRIIFHEKRKENS